MLIFLLLFLSLRLSIHDFVEHSLHCSIILRVKSAWLHKSSFFSPHKSICPLWPILGIKLVWGKVFLTARSAPWRSTEETRAGSSTAGDCWWLYEKWVIKWWYLWWVSYFMFVRLKTLRNPGRISTTGQPVLLFIHLLHTLIFLL